MLIVLGIPVPKNPLIDIRTAAFIASMTHCKGIKWVWSQSHFPELGRNTIIETELVWPEVSHFFFLDADTVPPPNAIHALLELDVDFACGLTPMIDTFGVPRWNVRVEGSEDMLLRSDPLPEKPFKVKHVGGTTILVRREVFEKIAWPWFKTEFTHVEDSVSSVEKGEDIYFCDKVHEHGYEITCHPEIQCNHYNTVDLLKGN